MNSELTPEQYKLGQPLKLCGKCQLRHEAIGGVMVRDKWYCSKCWIRFMNKK